MVIRYKSDTRDFLQNYLTILNPFLKTTDKEKDFLVELILLYLSNPKAAYTANTFTDISLKLSVSIDRINNIKKNLRSKKLLTEDNQLSTIVINTLPKSKEHEVTFKFSIQ